MKESQYVDRELVDGLLKALRELPQLDAHPVARSEATSARDRGVDAQIRLRAGCRDLTLLIETKRAVYPRDVREIVWQLRAYTQQLLDRTGAAANAQRFVPIVAAQTLSPGAKEILQHENIGYFDSGGSLFIPASEVYVYIQKPPPKSEQRLVRAVFTGKRSQALRALFHKQGEWVGVHELANLADVSPTTASETLTELERHEWVATRGQGPSKERRLDNPRALLEQWAAQIRAARPLPSRRYYVPGVDPSKLARRLADACSGSGVEYALTQEAAAQRYAPYLTSISRIACRMPPGRDAEGAIAELEARVVTEGSNLIVIETPTQGEFMFKEKHGGIWLASPLQVYLDLQQAEGRAKELADHLRKERVGF